MITKFGFYQVINFVIHLSDGTSHEGKHRWLDSHSSTFSAPAVALCIYVCILINIYNSIYLQAHSISCYQPDYVTVGVFSYFNHII
jgi:hypothetical protein